MDENVREKLKSLLPEPIALVGYGVEGVSTGAFLTRHGLDRWTVLDRQERSLPPGVEGFFGENYLSDLAKYRTVIRSAGVRPLGNPIEAFAAQGGVVTSQVQLFSDLYRGKMVAITGTMGKGTTTMMLSSILDRAGIDHAVGGNIGTPVLDLLEQNQPLVLLELSSFQLMGWTGRPDVAVVLRTTTEHLDWHTDVAEYRWAKSFIARRMSAEQVVVWCGDAEGSRAVIELSPARKRSYGTGAGSDRKITDEMLELDDGVLLLKECAVAGNFMLENMAAAAEAALALGVEDGAIRQGLREFRGLQYRLQYVGAAQGVRYYNDSYATRPEAALAAVRSFDEPVAIVLGGSEKYADFTELFDGLAAHPQLKFCGLIGETAVRLEEGLSARKVKCARCETLAQAVTECEAAVAQGGVVLLSPACASFGLFANYKIRGAAFDQLVGERIR